VGDRYDRSPLNPDSVTSICRLGALEQAGAIRRGELSSRDVIEAHLAHIEVVNPRVNALHTVLAEAARTEADEADRRLAGGEKVGPLHGVPVSIKENIDVAGTATTCGVSALAETLSNTDAPLVTNLRAAGAIPISRGNMPDFAMRWHTWSELMGATLNPWDVARTPGGSSGGEAVALATGMVPLGVGNDIGGSLRFPSQCVGIASRRRPTVLPALQ
jgi:amidase